MLILTQKNFTSISRKIKITPRFWKSDDSTDVLKPVHLFPFNSNKFNHTINTFRTSNNLQKHWNLVNLHFRDVCKKIFNFFLRCHATPFQFMVMDF